MSYIISDLIEMENELSFTKDNLLCILRRLDKLQAESEVFLYDKQQLYNHVMGIIRSKRLSLECEKESIY